MKNFEQYLGLPWKSGGFGRDGLDCRGLARLVINEEGGHGIPKVPTSENSAADADRFLGGQEFNQGDPEYLAAVFFRDQKDGKVRHVAVYLGDNQYLHILKGSVSRIDRGLTLMRRTGLVPAGWISSKQVERLAGLLNQSTVGETSTIVLFVIGVLLSVASAFLVPRPKAAKFKNQTGRYSPDGALATSTTTQIPLPDILGAVTVAGNKVFETLLDKSQTIDTPASQKWNKVIVVASGPVNAFTSDGVDLKINGLTAGNDYFYNDTVTMGLQLNPTQSKAAAVTGTVGSSSNVPTYTSYTGAHATSVPVDVRANYDRNFPVYGLSGCGYLVFRLIDSGKFPSFNLTCAVQGRFCRTFDSSGFVTTAVSAESLTGAHSYSAQAVTASTATDKISLTSHYLSNGDPVTFAASTMPGGLIAGVVYYVVEAATNDFKVAEAPGGTAIDLVTTNGVSVTITAQKTRFKLANWDIAAVSSLTVGGTSYAEISASAQTGNVYQLNKTKGYVEFLTAPANGTTILVDYTYYPREWTRNPASHLVYLLTEKNRGKGFDASRIEWASAVTLRDYCNEVAPWLNSNGLNAGARFTCNYSIDFRQPIQDHIRAVLDACYSSMFISQGKFVMKARTTGTSVFSFTTANILKDSFSSELISRADRANRVRVLYHSSDSLNAETEAVRDDLADQRARSERIGNGGVLDEQLKMPAVDSQAQAERLGETILREEVGSRWIVKLKTNIKGLPLEPLDLIDVTHPSQPAWSAKVFRIEDLQTDADDYLEITATEYFSAAFV
jgi:hypothetical protein